MDKANIPSDIMHVVDCIAEKYKPEKIYLFSNKRGGVGKTAGFKLCVVLESDDMSETEKRIYLGVDCEVPFDIVLYAPAIFDELLTRKGSFAQRIVKSGVLVYG